jgi:DNA-binding response OmpR family regulator
VESLSAAQEALGTKERPTILVADDDADLLGYLRIRLERAGYGVLTAGDGQEAVSLALGSKPDLAVLDVRMPILDGFRVTRMIRSSDTVAEMPVIFLSASDLAEDIAMGEEVGADEYLTKPLSAAQELLDAVSTALHAA